MGLPCFHVGVVSEASEALLAEEQSATHDRLCFGTATGQEAQYDNKITLSNFLASALLHGQFGKRPEPWTCCAALC